MLLQATNLCRDGEKAHETIMTHLKIKGLFEIVIRLANFFFLSED